MRKLMAIVILLVYALSSSGTSLYLHYCCGMPHVMAINEQPEAHDPCAMCSEAEHHDGSDCDDESCDLAAVHHGCQDVYWDTVDATNEHITYADKGTQSIAQPAEISLLWSIDVAPFVADGSVTCFADSSPPEVSGIPLFIFHCTYRI